MKILISICSLVVGAVAAYLFISLGMLNSLPGIQEEPAFQLPVYLNFIGVMMTIVTVVLTAVAIGIAVVAIYTFREIEKKVLKAAADKIHELAEAANGKIQERLSDESLRALIEKNALKPQNPGDRMR